MIEPSGKPEVPSEAEVRQAAIDDALAKVRVSYDGDLFLLTASPDHQEWAIARLPAPGELRTAWRVMEKDSFGGNEALVTACVLFPEKQALGRMLERKAALALTWGQDLLKAGGFNSGVNIRKL